MLAGTAVAVIPEVYSLIDIVAIATWLLRAASVR